MSETQTTIVVFSNVDITVDNINYNIIYTVEGLIENVSKAESQINAMLRQSFEQILRPIAGRQINIEPVTETRNFCEMGLPHFPYIDANATPVIRNRQTGSMLSILVPSDIVGVIIGRGGSTIQGIMEQTSARINVNKNDITGYSEKAITIFGTPENCTNACRKILEVLLQKASDTSQSNVILSILIPDNLIGLIIGEEGNAIRNIVSETDTKINVLGIIDITIDNINYKRVCKVEGLIENVSKAESQISVKLRQSFEKYLHQVAGCQINVEPVMEMRNFNEMRLPHFSYGGSGATPDIRDKQTESLLCILVHSNMVHAIIGNHGSTIKEITQQTNAWVHVQPKYNSGSMEQVVIVKGNPENCTNACLNILEALQQKATNSRSSSSNVVLKILIPDTIIGIIIEEEGNMVRKIMSDTETKINVSSITGITIDSVNYKTICTIEGSVENTCKAESQISAKLRQSIEHFLQSVDGFQIKVEPALEMRNLCEIGHTHVSHVGQKEFTLRILVPSDMIPIIIGKHGSTIKEITQQTSAKVHVDQKYSVVSTEKAITIKGIPENCTDACRKILDVMGRKSYDVVLKILVHNNQIGVIIGKEGNIIKKIMSETDTNITVPSITDITIDSFNDERIFTVQGCVDNISKAEARISSKLRQCLKNISHYKLTRLVEPEMADKKYKLIIVGHSNVGKSSIVKRYCKDIYQFTKPTIGVDIQQIFVRFNNETIHLEIWDTAGTEDYQCLASSYKGAHGVFVVYDITDSSCKLEGRIEDIKTLSDPNSVIILIGSKCDDRTNRKISIKEAHRIAEMYRIPFLEVSSKTNVNIDCLFYTMISKIYDLQNQLTDINKELVHINDKMKSKLNSDVKPNTIPVRCQIMDKELPDTPNILSEYNDKEHYKLIRVQPDQNTIFKKYKLIIVGHSNVGKSSIIHRLVKDVYEDTLKTTIGINFHEIFVRFENETIQLNIWDTAGTETYRSLAQSYYRGAHGIFIVYDITNAKYLVELNNWKKDVEDFSDLNAVKILIGSKCDDTSNRKVSIKEGQELAKEYGISFFEVSSKTNINIDKLLYTMISRIHDKQKELLHTNDTMKPKLDSDVKPKTIPVQCPKMEKKIPDVPNMEFDDSQHYNLERVKSETTSKKFKLIIVGSSNVGKSAMINRFCKGVYDDTVPTPGMDFKKIYIRFENEIIELNIWDTGGTEKYRSLAPSYYRGAHGIFIVYDITDAKSLVKVNDWKKDVEDFSDFNAVKILIGSKCDDTSNRKISIKEGQELAKKCGISFFEVSSKTNINLNKLLYTMISRIYEHQYIVHQTPSILLRIPQPNWNTIILGDPSSTKKPVQQHPGGCSC
ncbi:uncharacterized protein LOC111042124 isoform X3 [Myzus persicae]|uniref:uncharacterized protein LOC111042124 isoform X3 n=1 Tax=Myzus persicae TaxID=13164 RepID=UPI000B939B09|nr:uncharacterized protein LOC111042124 isoform X3 [Myzus persicae]